MGSHLPGAAVSGHACAGQIHFPSSRYVTSETPPSWSHEDSDDFELSLPICCPPSCGYFCDECGGSNNGADVDMADITHAKRSLFDRLGDSIFRWPQSPAAVSPRQIPHDAPVEVPHIYLLPEDRIIKPKDWMATGDYDEKDYWTRMNQIIHVTGVHFESNGLSSGRVIYLDDDATGFPVERPPIRAGGAEQVGGCTIFVAASNLGVMTAHIWEHPTFIHWSYKFGQVGEYGPRTIDTEAQQAAYEENVHRFFARVLKHDDADHPERATRLASRTCTEWRQFRIFSPRRVSLGPDSQELKNKPQMEKLFADITRILRLEPGELKLHSPNYTPYDPEDTTVHPWTNVFAWQFAPAVPHSGGGSSSSGSSVRRHFVAHWDGQEIRQMRRTWSYRHRSARLKDICMLHVRVFPFAVDKEDEYDFLQFSATFYSPQERGGTPLHQFSEMEYELGKEGPRIRFDADAIGIKERVEVWFTEDKHHRYKRHDDMRPDYDYFHINAKFGSGARYEYKKDATSRSAARFPKCRGGSWEGLEGGPTWYRDTYCHFKCALK
ncbi:hypothetical protein SODALDRAFT_360343 [Sodiomyces alkalinus F11]|uniref:Uncharacterized protein n=1 Tax=Sodiomyces alkalinus (strain CBS 110278 / VKM F-3762 / F11) TaxID=1314773 RepID=A0A3N2PU37_SODAK|nr:hypothetical protein SODALDRAFT_360343 [Sodiomyces alkalinus F11]ROT38023.1 hypothetical protein SODALDRAFT_360343 [Sodiomyces alkalinus F11]